MHIFFSNLIKELFFNYGKFFYYYLRLNSILYLMKYWQLPTIIKLDYYFP
jgi:hypothetical protein